MTKRIFRTFWSVFTLLALLILLAPWALADDGAAAGTDAIRVGEDGTVTLLSGHIAGEGVSSLQMTLKIAEGEAGFTFSEALQAAYMTNVTSGEGGLTLYIAGTKPLMAAGQTELVLGTVSGAAPGDVTLAAGSPQYVYGTRLIAQNPESDDGLGESSVKSELRSEMDLAGVFGLDSVQELYTDESIQALLDAAGKAAALLEDPDASDDDLQLALDALRAARQGLRTVAAGELEQHLADALTKVEGGYTPESLENLRQAINEAQDAKTSGDEERIQQATEALQDALKNLVPMTEADSSGPVIPDGDIQPRSGESLPGVVGDVPGGTGDTNAAATAAPAAASGQSAVPHTGDDAALLPWTMLLVLSGALLTAVIRRRTRCGR